MLGLDDGLWSAVLGVVLLTLGIGKAMRVRKAGRWRSVDGEILESQVVNRGSSFLPHWQAEVRYRYTVGGVEYQGSRISLTLRREGDVRWPAQSDANAYPQGAKVKVYVSTEDPAMAVLERELHWSGYLELVVGGLFVAYATYVMLT